MSKNRVTFGSKIGTILATVGCAVGLGNIWRFPYMLGENGGAAFLAVYIVCIILIGIPVMMTEFFIGRKTRSNAARSFKILAPGTKWCMIGYAGVLTAFFILGFYSVVAGWTLEYIVQSITGSFDGKSASDFASEFSAFSSNPYRQIFWTIAFITLTHVVITFGVDKGIERASKVMMPLLFIILMALCIRSVTLPGAVEGLKFLFNPELEKLTSSVVLSAMGQAFFSLSIGMGCLITYSSYFEKTSRIQNTAIQVAILDTFVAILAGIMIFPAVFSFGIEPTAGPELVFITLPNVFAQLPFGAVWSFIFFILLALAALTSTISLHEVVTAYVHEEFNVTRKEGARIISIGVIILGIFSSLSLGPLKECTIFGMSFFDFLDYFTAKLMMPLGGMMICIFVGRYIDRNVLKDELTNQGTIHFYLFNIYTFIIKYLAPVAIALIFVNELGLIDYLRKVI